GAAEVVLSAGCNTTLLPLDVIRNVALPTHAIAAIRSTSPGLTYVKEYIVDRQLKIRSFHMWDEVLSAVLLNPSLVTKTSKVFISVETRDGSEYGKVRSVSATRGNLVKVISEINDEATEAFIIDALK